MKAIILTLSIFTSIFVNNSYGNQELKDVPDKQLMNSIKSDLSAEYKRLKAVYLMYDGDFTMRLAICKKYFDLVKKYKSIGLDYDKAFCSEYKDLI